MTDTGVGQGSPGAPAAPGTVAPVPDAPPGTPANVLQPAPQGTPPLGQPPLGPSGAAWHAGFANEDQAAYIANKGWDGPGKMFESYVNLEKLIGQKTDAFSIPHADDAAGWGSLYAKLGRPNTGEEYTLPQAADGADPIEYDNDVISWFRNAAHDAGMTDAAFNKTITSYNTMVQQREDKETADMQLDMDKATTTLRTTWGADYDQKMVYGNQAAKKLGLENNDVLGIQKALGSQRAAELMVAMGTLMAQDKAIGLDSQPPEGFTTSAARAKQKMDEIKQGKEPKFLEALQDVNHVGHKSADAQWRKWLELTHGNR